MTRVTRLGIVRTVEWRLTQPPEEADQRLRDALTKLGMTPEGDAGRIRAKSGRSVLKNRWAAEIGLELEPLDGGTLAVARVDMLGNKHYALLSEVIETAGDDLFEDRRITDAVERLGNFGRMFGRKEVRHLKHLLRGSERVIILGQGQYEKKQGLIVLTDERLFFFEKSLLGQETVEEFSLKSITSLETGKKMTGERLVVHVSGNRSEITGMIHGQADEIVRQFRKLRADHEAAAAQPARAIVDDPIAQLEKLASLRERGIISAEEFDRKKAELIDESSARTPRRPPRTYNPTLKKPSSLPRITQADVSRTRLSGTPAPQRDSSACRAVWTDPYCSRVQDPSKYGGTKMSSENEQPANDVQHVESDAVERRSATEVVVGLAPAAVTAVGIGINYWQNRPPKPEPPKVELPPGVERD